MAAAFCGALVCCLLSIDDLHGCLYRLWLFSLTARCSLGTVLIGLKPQVRCTAVASVVSVFIGVEKETWPISHFCDRVDRHASHAYYAAPSRASE